MAQRNAYLISRALKNFLIASILTLVVQQLTVTVDGIIVSHLVGVDAMSAITLYVPLNMAIMALTTFLGIGATVIAAQAMGRQDKEAVDGILSTAFVSVLVIGLLMGVGFWFARTWITELMCSEMRLRDYFHDYSTIMLSFAIMPMLNLFFNQITAIDGHPQMVTKAVVCSFFTNAILDYVLVGPVGMGISGSAWATVIAYGVGIGVLSVYVFGRKSSFSLVPAWNMVRRYLGQNLVQGLPLLLANLVITCMFLGMNLIVQDALGADGMFVLAICINLLSISTLVATGYGDTLMAVGGYLKGEGDSQGMQMLVHRCMKSMIFLVIIVTLVLEIFPSVVCAIFGVDTPELEIMAMRGIRLFSLILIPYALVLLLANLYQMLGHLKLIPVLIMLCPAILLPSMLVWINAAGADSMWNAFPQTGVFMVLFAYALSEVARRRMLSAPVSRFTLLPAEEEETFVYQESVLANVPEVGKSLEGKLQFLQNQGLDKGMVNRICLCVEELILNIAQHGGRRIATHYFDVRIVCRRDSVVVSVKDDGRPFDPTMVNEERRSIGLTILNNLCQEIEYKYMFGQNVTYMTWRMNETVE